MEATMGTIETTETPVASPAAKLGTHNSLSYLRPRQWWLRPFNWIARCQSMTIKEQWDYGVRYFDIRVKYDKNGVAKSGHGLMSYDVLPWDILGLVDRYAMESKEQAVVRLFHENSKRKPREHRGEFAAFCQKAISEFTHIHFVEGGSRYDYVRVIQGNVPTRVCYAEYFRQKLCMPFPERWAKKNNQTLHRGDNADEWSVYDFVEL